MYLSYIMSDGEPFQSSAQKSITRDWKCSVIIRHDFFFVKDEFFPFPISFILSLLVVRAREPILWNFIFFQIIYGYRSIDSMCAIFANCNSRRQQSCTRHENNSGTANLCRLDPSRACSMNVVNIYIKFESSARANKYNIFTWLSYKLNKMNSPHYKSVKCNPSVALKVFVVMTGATRNSSVEFESKKIPSKSSNSIQNSSPSTLKYH